MTKCTPSLVIASMLAFALHAAPAQAQARVFVAAQGLDTNPCTFAQPCRSFQKAHDTVVANGEIDVLDPAGYGAVTITKSISIQGHGFAGITAGSGNAITINATSGKINLRGLLLEYGLIGIDATNFGGDSVNVQECSIRRFSIGIAFAMQHSAALLVSDSVLSDNGGEGIELVNIGPPGSRVTAVL